VEIGLTTLHADIKLSRPEGFHIDVNISMPAGTTVALLGPNGAGKSTVVAALAGLLPVDSGCMRIGSLILDDPASSRFVVAEDRNFGVVFQDYLLFPNMTVRDNIAFPLRNQSLRRKEANAACDEWLEKLGLKGLEYQKPATLSGGEAQRVALARALISRPTVLLLDEPMAALDVNTRAGLQTILKEHLDAFAGPRLLITHDPREAFLFADQIHIIESGRITQSGDANDIRLRPVTAYAAGIAGGWSLD
jgi:molybdate transport system ATP-binding protein